MKSLILTTCVAALLLVACNKNNAAEADGSHALENLRMAQYGFSSKPNNPDDLSNRDAIRKLETLLKKITVVSKEKPASLTTGVTTEEAASPFGITDSNTHDEVQQWLKWFIYRFKPVYLAHMTELYKAACSTDIDREDQLLSTNQRIELAMDVQSQLIGQKSPFAIMDSPWVSPSRVDGTRHATNQLDMDAKAVESQYTLALKYMVADRKDHDSQVGAPTPGCNASASPTGSPPLTANEPGSTPGTQATNATAAPASQPHPSFDCAKAATVTEKMICGNPELASLDSRMAPLFKRWLALSENPSDTKNQQIAWNKEKRDACPDAACVKNGYEARIAQINSDTDNEVHARCGSAKPVFICMTKERKEIKVCDSGKSFTLTYGALHEKPLINLTKPREEVNSGTLPTPPRTDSVNLKDGSTKYEVYFSWSIPDDENLPIESDSGLQVTTGDKDTHISCQADSSVNLIQDAGLSPVSE